MTFLSQDLCLTDADKTSLGAANETDAEKRLNAGCDVCLCPVCSPLVLHSSRSYSPLTFRTDFGMTFRTQGPSVSMLINHHNHIKLDSICRPETLQNTCFVVGKFENIGDRALPPNRLNHDSSSQQPQPIQFVPPLERTHSGLNSNGAVVAISCAFKNELGSSSAKLPSPQ